MNSVTHLVTAFVYWPLACNQLKPLWHQRHWLVALITVWLRKYFSCREKRKWCDVNKLISDLQTLVSLTLFRNTRLHRWLLLCRHSKCEVNGFVLKYKISFSNNETFALTPCGLSSTCFRVWNSDWRKCKTSALRILCVITVVSSSIQSLNSDRISIGRDQRDLCLLYTSRCV